MIDKRKMALRLSTTHHRHHRYLPIKITLSLSIPNHRRDDENDDDDENTQRSQSKSMDGEERDGARDSKKDVNVGQCLSLSINAKTSQLFNIFEQRRRGGGRSQ